MLVADASLADLGDQDDPIEKRDRVNFYRRIKRKIRKSIGWNQLPMRYQLRVHLFSLFGIFFVLYFLCMLLYTQIRYVNEVVRVVTGHLDPILEDRLQFSAEAVSTTFYMVDKLGVDATLRLSEFYEQSQSEEFPFPVKVNAY